MSTSLLVPAPTPLRKRIGRPIGAAVAALALLVSGAALAAPAAHAVTTSTLTVNVSAPDGLAPSGIGLQLYSVDPVGDLVDTGLSNTSLINGPVTFPGLPAGSYTVRAYGLGGPQQFPLQYLGNAFDKYHAQRVAVNADTSIDFAIVPGTTVSGSVKDSVGNAVLTTVKLMVPTGANGTRFWAMVAEADVESDGTFAIDRVLPGTYSLLSESQDDQLSTWLGGKNGDQPITGPTTFTVATAPQSAKDIVTSKAGTLAGLLKNASGVPIDFGRAYLYEQVTDAFGNKSFDNNDAFEGYVENGEYEFARIAPGVYTLEVSINSTDQSQFLGGTNSALSATTFTIAKGENKVLNYQLRAKTITAASTTTVALSKAKSAYGTSAGTATVTVTGTQAVTGSVQLLDGAKNLGTKPLAGGKASFALSATTTVGTHSLKARYASTGVLADSTSAARTLVVTKASAKVSAKLAKTSIKKSARGSLTVKVTATGTVPSGKVIVKDGKKTLTTVTLVKGAKTITLPKLGKGKHKLTVTYGGSTTVAGSSSASTTLTVR